MEQLGVGCTGPVGKPRWREPKGLIGLGLGRRDSSESGGENPGP